MKRFLRKLLFFLLLGLGALLLGAVLTATLFERPIGRRVVEALNAQLSTRLEVGSFDLSFLAAFPNLTASLREVALYGSDGGLLVQADQMAFSLSLTSFIAARYDLHGLDIADGVLHLRYDATGAPNFAIFRPEAPPRIDFAEGESLAFSIRQARLRRIELDYDHAGSGERARFRIDEARFSGAFSARRFSLDSRASGQLGYVETGGERFLVNQPFNYRADLQVDRGGGQLRVHGLDLALGDSRLQLAGAVRRQAAGLHYDLELRGDRVELDDALHWLPRRWGRAYRAAGTLRLRGALRGDAPPGGLPPFTGSLELDRGRLMAPGLPEDLNDLAFSASLRGGDGRPPRLEFDRLSGYFGRERLEARGSVEGLGPSRIDLSLDGNLPLRSFYPVLAERLGHPGVERGTGELELQRLRYRGTLTWRGDTAHWSKPSLTGRVVLDDAGLRIRGEDLLFDRGALVFEGNTLRADRIKLEGPGTALTLTGTAVNALPGWLGAPDAPVATVSGSLRGERLDLDQLLRLLPRAAPDDAPPQQLEALARARLRARARWARSLRGTLTTRLNALNYQEATIDAFDGDLLLHEGRLNIRGQARTMEGRVDLDATLALREQPTLNARITGQGVSIGEAFRQWNDFGQTTVTSRHIDGRLEAQVRLDAAWDAAGRFRPEQLQLQARLAITDGELNQLGPLEQFADHVRVEDLRQVRFADLEHYLEIRNGTVYLPVLFLRSNALNLSVSGLHRFSGAYRYHLKINAGQVLMQRLRAHDPSLAPKPARRRGFFNLYYTLDGNAEQLRVSRSKGQARTDLERSAQRLRYLRQTLREAFGDTPPLREPEGWGDAS